MCKRFLQKVNKLKEGKFFLPMAEKKISKIKIKKEKGKRPSQVT